MDWERISADLQRKLDPAHVKPAKSFGPKGDYIEGWHAMAEANRIFGFAGWDYTVSDCRCVSDRPRRIGKEPNAKDGFGVSYVATVIVTVDGVVRQDVGAGHGYDVDCGLAHESAIKEAVTDALKRALRSFGNPFGLALYDKSRENVGVDAPPVDHLAHERAVTDAQAMIESADSLPDLQGVWKALKPTVQAVPAVIAAKDARKQQLQQKDAA